MALANLSHSELPNRRVEAWKYSDLRAALADQPLVLRDGRDIIERLAPGTQRTRIPAGETRLFVERMPDETYLDARAFEFDVEPGAALTRVVIQTGAGPALSTARVRVGANGKFRQFVLTEGSKLTRIETHVEVNGEGAAIELYGVYLAGEGRHADLTSRIDHNVPGGTTQQLIKGAARKGGRGVFQGKIVVAYGAQKTDARQNHHGLLLDEGAEIYAKPELEIYADDVQCAHGNTAGSLDEAALFYMRSRGVPETEARAMLVEAFLLEAIPEDLPEELRAELSGRVSAWLR